MISINLAGDLSLKPGVIVSSYIFETAMIALSLASSALGMWLIFSI